MLIYKAIGEIVRHIAPEALGSLSMETDYQDEPEAPKRKGSIDISEKTEALPEGKKDKDVEPVIPTVEDVNKNIYNRSAQRERNVRSKWSAGRAGLVWSLG